MEVEIENSYGEKSVVIQLLGVVACVRVQNFVIVELRDLMGKVMNSMN